MTETMWLAVGYVMGFAFMWCFVMPTSRERAYLRGYRQAAWDHKHAGGFDKYNLKETP